MSESCLPARRDRVRQARRELEALAAVDEVVTLSPSENEPRWLIDVALQPTYDAVPTAVLAVLVEHDLRLAHTAELRDHDLYHALAVA